MLVAGADMSISPPQLSRSLPVHCHFQPSPRDCCLSELTAVEIHGILDSECCRQRLEMLTVLLRSDLYRL